MQNQGGFRLRVSIPQTGRYNDYNENTIARAEKFRAICEQIAELYEAKDAAYGNSFGETYAKLGIISAATRISDKCNRLCSLAVNPNIDDLGESIEDTLMDLAAYSVMTIIELRK